MKDAAGLFVSRGVKAVGIDSASLDEGECKSFDAHRIILSGGCYGIENINSEISRVPEKGATIIIAPIKIKGGSGAPARVVALIPI